MYLNYLLFKPRKETFLKIEIIKKIRIAILIVILFFLQNLNAQIYDNSLLENAEGLLLLGHSKHIPNQGIMITSDSKDQRGIVLLNSVDVPSTSGMYVEFDLAIYGGKGTNEGADGLTMFIVDRDNRPTVESDIGTKGQALGYNFLGPVELGLKGGYLGIGFDAWGSFRRRETLQFNRTNGYPSTARVRDQIVIRGKWNGIERNLGYPVLIGRELRTTKGYSLDFSNGNINNHIVSNLNTKINSGSLEWRKVIVKLTKHQSDGYIVNVEYNGVQVITDFHYPTSMTYKEQSVKNNNNEKPLTYDTSAPAYVNMGFSAATGSSTQIHMIRGLKFSVPFVAITESDVLPSIQSCFTESSLDVIENDKAYGESILTASQEPKNEYVDKSSFLFHKQIPFTEENQGFETVGIYPPNGPFIYSEEGVGIWSYNPNTGVVTFTKETSYVGEASINYSIKGKGDWDPVTNPNSMTPYNKEEYRSSKNATISVNVIKDDETCATCYKPAIKTGIVLDTKVGISTLNRTDASSDNWPHLRKGGWISLESSDKGFVINRIAFANEDNDITTPETPVGIPSSDFVEGMTVYDESNKCLKVYTSKDDGKSYAWYCMNTPACPDY